MRILVLSLLIFALILDHSVVLVAHQSTSTQPSQRNSKKLKSKVQPSKTVKSNKQKQPTSSERKSGKVNKSKSKRPDAKTSKSTPTKSKAKSRDKEREGKQVRSKARSQPSSLATSSSPANDTHADGKRALSNPSDTTTSRLDTVAKASANEPSQEQQRASKQAPIIIQEALLAADHAIMLKLLKPDGLEINLMNNRGRYLPKEATKLLSLFYQQYTPTSLKWVHKGRTKSGLFYLLGKLQCLTSIGQAKPSSPKPEAKTTEVALYLVYRFKNNKVMIQNLELNR